MSTQLSLLADHVERPRRMVSHHTRGKIHGPAAEVAAELQRNERNARTQDAAILKFFRTNPGAWGPSVVTERMNMAYPWAGLLLWSVRRGITNLTGRGFLRKTTERRPSRVGGMEHLWTLSEGETR